MTRQKMLQPEFEIRALKQQLFQAQKLGSIGAIASSVAHEFNNILTTIINYTRMASRSTDEESRKQALEKVLKGGQRAAVIVNSMLGFARKGKQERASVDLASLVEEVLVLTSKDLSKYQIRIETNFVSRPKAPVIASQVEQVLMNLVINARQAMPLGGKLRIEVRECADSGFAEIVVADSGQGISPENMGRIFNPFFTTKLPDEHGNGGTGLGLYVCRQILEEHQGRLRVESKVGKGTVFAIKLPTNPEGQQFYP
ncbi:MAG: sensor histidine kinase [Gemmataceae bacterium]|nr:sensor histidine kinase [Gemmataceae bacterium]